MSIDFTVPDMISFSLNTLFLSGNISTSISSKHLSCSSKGWFLPGCCKEFWSELLKISLVLAVEYRSLWWCWPEMLISKKASSSRGQSVLEKPITRECWSANYCRRRELAYQAGRSLRGGELQDRCISQQPHSAAPIVTSSSWTLSWVLAWSAKWSSATRDSRSNT